MYRRGGVVTSNIESDVTASSVCVVLLLVVYRLSRQRSHVNARESSLPQYNPHAPDTTSINSK